MQSRREPTDPVVRQIKETVYRFVDPRQYRVFVFGSRVTGHARRYSDYDVGIHGSAPLPAGVKTAIEEAFEDSDLPYTVDLVDFARVSDQFRSIAGSKVQEL